MDALIYRDLGGTAENLAGRIDRQGKVYGLIQGEDKYCGWIDYEEGDIYNSDNEVLGWIEAEGEIICSTKDGEEAVGYVDVDGEVFAFKDEIEIHLGRVADMQDSAEAAAAMLLLLERV